MTTLNIYNVLRNMSTVQNDRLSRIADELNSSSKPKFDPGDRDINWRLTATLVAVSPTFRACISTDLKSRLDGILQDIQSQFNQAYPLTTTRSFSGTVMNCSQPSRRV